MCWEHYDRLLLKPLAALCYFPVFSMLFNGLLYKCCTAQLVSWAVRTPARPIWPVIKTVAGTVYLSRLPEFSSHCVVRWSIFSPTETDSWSGPVRLHLRTRPSHLDQSAVLGGHLLLWGAKPDQSTLPHHPWGETTHHCQDQGKVLKSTFLFD